MRYSQPFGTPTPPLGSYPRYINGNPVTGTEGSIPPASAFDEDQIEIVTVIANVGLTPDHSDLTQLWQAIQLLIQQKYITAPIVKKVHGPGADFVDLYAALAWLGNYIITPTGTVTFLVANGKWTYLSTLELSHPNINRVTIQGGALLGASPQPGNISVTGYSLSNDKTNQIIYLRSVYATELSFTGGVSGFRSFAGGLTLRYLLISGSQDIASPPNYGRAGCGLDAYEFFNVDGCAFWGFGDTGIAIEGTMVQMTSSLSLTVCACGISGIEARAGYFIGNGIVITASCGGQGVLSATSYSHFRAGLNSKGNGTPTGSVDGYGIIMYGGGYIRINVGGGNMQINKRAGAWVQSGTLEGEGNIYSNNGQYGVYMDGGKAWINNSTLSGNGTRDVNLQGGSDMELIGSSYTSTQPPINTEQNNSLIIY